MSKLRVTLSDLKDTVEQQHHEIESLEQKMLSLDSKFRIPTVENVVYDLEDFLVLVWTNMETLRRGLAARDLMAALKDRPSPPTAAATAAAETAMGSVKAAEERATAEHSKRGWRRRQRLWQRLKKRWERSSRPTISLRLAPTQPSETPSRTTAVGPSLLLECRRLLHGSPGGVAGYRPAGAPQPATTDARQHNQRLSGREVQEGASCL